jgi:hypothetical protein
MFQVGVARGKAEKLLAMEEEEGSCKQEEFYTIEEPVVKRVKQLQLL